jgi:serine-type D-Ala-D-Ala carboxypeptidase (penicillin-binding protein 5/6)
MKFFFILSFATSVFGEFSTSNQVESAILINSDTGRILYEKKGYERRFPASVTKIATALYALDAYKIQMDSHLIIDPILYIRT